MTDGCAGAGPEEMAPRMWQASPLLLSATPRLREVFCLSPRGRPDRLAVWPACPPHIVLPGPRRTSEHQWLSFWQSHWSRGLASRSHSNRAGEGRRGPLSTGNIPFLIWLLVAWVFLVCENSSSYTLMYVYYKNVYVYVMYMYYKNRKKTVFFFWDELIT